MSFLDKDSTFISSYTNDNLKAQDAVVSLTTTPRGLPELTCTNKKKKLFYIYIENLPPNHIHINKNMKLGHLFKSDDIKKNPNVNSNNQLDLELFVNITKATPDIINKRKDEFATNKIKISHLPQHLQHKLFAILLKYFAAFSSFIETLDQSDRISPVINFSSY